jgi:hypothetical protein
MENGKTSLKNQGLAEPMGADLLEQRSKANPEGSKPLAGG